MGLRFKDVVRRIFLLPLNFYQRFIARHLPPACLYHPSCSEYTRQSILKFGIIRGVILGLVRIFRCNGMFFYGGIDEVPEKFSFKGIQEDYKKFGRRK